MASAVNPITGSSSTGSSAAAASAMGASAPSEEMFLQLLVAQLQNQDPLNPTDSTQFVSQLAQFSELEQVMAIRSDIETEMAQGAAQQTQSSTSTTTPSTGQTQS